MKPWIIATVLVLALVQGVSAAGTMSVQIKKGVLKSLPSFLGQNVGTVTYGDRVTPLMRDGAWIKVLTPSQQGWLHETALTDKRIVLQSGSTRAASGVSSDEIMLAGKGFNSQVEAKYREENPKLRFDRVDAMEHYSVSPETERRFAERGRLKL